jgi:hypothetical protein
MRRDYRAMSGMIFGESPLFDAVIKRIAELEERLNLMPRGAVDHGES